MNARRVSERHRGQPGGSLELDQGDIATLVVAQHASAVGLAIANVDGLDAGRLRDHMVVREHQPGRRQDHAGPRGRTGAAVDAGVDVDEFGVNARDHRIADDGHREYGRGAAVCPADQDRDNDDADRRG